MSLPEEHLFSRLTGFAGLTSLVSSRVYSIKLPSNCTFPAVTYFRVSSNPVESMTGSSALSFARFQLDSWAKTYTEAKNLAEQVRLCLQGYKGTIAGITFFGVNFIGDRDLFDDEAEIYRVSADYWIHYNETLP